MKNKTVIFMPHPPLLIPEIGDGKERAIQETQQQMESLAKEIALMAPKTIIVISPHGNAFSNGTCVLKSSVLKGNFGMFGYPHIQMEKRMDLKLIEALEQVFEGADFQSLFLDELASQQYGVSVHLDHGAMVPLYFVDQYYSDYQLVHITPGFTSLQEQYEIGQTIAGVLEYMTDYQENDVLILCSGDMSHALKTGGPYEFHPEGPVFDQLVKDAVNEGDVLKLLTIEESVLENAAQCGLRSFLMGLGTLSENQIKSQVLSYEGPFGVGYLTAKIERTSEKLDKPILAVLKEQQEQAYALRCNQEDACIQLARKTIEHYTKTGKRFESLEEINQLSLNQQCLNSESLQVLQQERKGCFVSLHKGGQLRGCIGTISPAHPNLFEEIVYNAISACSQDPRFEPVEVHELKQLDIKVDILMPYEAIKDISELDVIKYGVIVEKGSKRGLLLPNLEGITTTEQQVKIAMEKAGIQDQAHMKMYRFEVIRHEVKHEAKNEA